MPKRKNCWDVRTSTALYVSLPRNRKPKGRTHDPSAPAVRPTSAPVLLARHRQASSTRGGVDDQLRSRAYPAAHPQCHALQDRIGTVGRARVGTPAPPGVEPIEWLLLTSVPVL